MSEYSIDRRTLLQTTGAGLVGGGTIASTASAQTDGRLRWEFGTGSWVQSSPTVVDDTVYVGSVDGSVYAVAAESGEQAWAFGTGEEVRSSPTVVHGIVYVGSGNGSVYAVTAATGEQAWAFETDGWVQSAPTVADGTVYVGSADGSVYAIDAVTGKQTWVFETGDEVWSSPTVVDGTVYVGSDANSVYAIDAETGDQEWAFETGDGVRSSPTVAHGIVYVGSADGSVYAIDAATGDREWAFEIGDSVYSSPTAVDDTVYVGSDDGSVRAIDATTGEQSWTFDTYDRVGSSPTVADGTVYVGSDDTGVYAIDAATGEQEWVYATGDWVVSSPTVVDGTVYVGSWDGSLYALEADTDGSSEGSRVRLETLGHHDRDGTDGEDYRFVDVDQSYEGGIANVTIGIEGSGTATVVLGHDDDGHVSAVELEEIAADELVLQYDLSAANDAADEFGWSVRSDSDATIANVAVDTQLEADQSLPAHTWDLFIGAGLDESDGTYAVDDLYDRDVLVIAEPVVVGEYEPTDSTGDGLYNDFDGDGETTHDDVSAFFEHLESDAIQDNPERFDFDGNDRVGFGDVVELLRRV